MEIEQTRKRSYEEHAGEDINKRSCSSDEDAAERAVDCHLSFVKTPPMPSVEAIIAVPLDLVFRQVTQSQDSSVGCSESTSQRRKPLLSRSEAQCFLSVRLLAQQIDSIVETTATVLQKKHRYHTIVERISSTDNPFLRPILPILATLGEHIPGQTLQAIQSQLDSAMNELQNTSAALRQFAEQNWTLADSLMETIGTSGESMAKDKRKLSDIQDEVCTRIEKLIAQQQFPNKDHAADTTWPPPIKEYCERVWSREDTGPRSPSASQQSQQSQHSLPPPARRTTLPGKFEQDHSQGLPESSMHEKENAPSQPSSSSMSESPGCQLFVGGATQNAAEVLSGLASASQRAEPSAKGTEGQTNLQDDYRD